MSKSNLDKPVSPTPETSDLDELKSRLVGDDYFTFQARCVKVFGPEAGIFLRQLVYRTGQSRLRGGWLWKTEAEMEDETGLSRSQQRKARKILTGYGVVEEYRKGVPRRMHYRVNLIKLEELLETPRSTLNQWKRGMKLNEETGKFYRPEPDPLNPNYREDGSTDLASEDGITDPTSEDGNTDPASRDDSTDLADEDRITDRAFQRKQQRVPQEDIPENSTENSTHHLNKKSSYLDGYASDFEAAAGRAIEQRKEVSEGEVSGAATDDNAAAGQEPALTVVPEPPAELDGQRKGDLWRLMDPLEEGGQTPVSRMTACYLDGRNDDDGESVTVERIAARAREMLGGDESLEAYVRAVEEHVRGVRCVLRFVERMQMVG